MPSPVRQQLLRLTAALPPDPTDPDLQPVTTLLAEVASGAPKRAAASVKALLRHGCAPELSAATRTRLAELAMLEIGRGRPTDADRPARPVFGAWYTVGQAASRLEVRVDTLLRRLEQFENRRRLGYPQWDGYQWRFASLAVEPETSAGFLATLPEHEPLEDLLPDWCVREGQSRAPRDAQTDEERRALRRRALDAAPEAA